MVIRGPLPILALLLASLGCEPPCEGSMLDSPGGLVLVAEEHPDGWGQEDCTDCHALEALHRSGCTEGVDMDAVRERVATDALTSCAPCHGDNGVSP